MSGLSDGSLYYYEKLGLLHPQRMKNNYRVYSKSDVGKVICVQKYNRLGVSVQQLVHTFEDQDIEYMHRIMEKNSEEKRRGTGKTGSTAVLYPFCTAGNRGDTA